MIEKRLCRLGRMPPARPFLLTLYIVKKARIEKELELFPLSEETQMSPVLIKKRTKLSTAQATFNRLNKKIVALRHDIQELPEREKVITDFYKKHVHALFVKEGELKYALLIRLDTVYQTGKLTEKNKSLLAELVLAESEQIDDFPLSDAQIEEMHRIREKYELIVSELTPEEMEKERVKKWKKSGLPLPWRHSLSWVANRIRKCAKLQIWKSWKSCLRSITRKRSNKRLRESLLAPKHKKELNRK